MEKRGVSAIVATVLIVLISLIGVGIIWVSFFSMIDGISDMGLRDVRLKIVSSEGYTVWDNESRLLSVQIERIGEGDVCGFDLIFVIGGNSVTHFVEEVLDVNENRVFYFNLSEYEGMLEVVRVAPVFCDGEVGDVTSELRFGDIGEGDLQGLIDEGVLDAEDFAHPSGSSGGGGSGSSEDGVGDYCGDEMCGDGEFCGNCEVDCGECGECLEDCNLYNGDGFLDLSQGGYASRVDAEVADLDYSKDFSVEVLTKIEPHSIGGRWASFIQKSGSRALYLSSDPGFAIGMNQGHMEYFGQSLTVKVGDGTNHVALTSSLLEGYVYAVMAWDSTAKELILYINGEESSRGNNSLINNLDIKNSNDLKVGIGTYGGLERDIFMMRIWNRGLSSGEVLGLWNNYDVTGQHRLVFGFDSSELYSEWLMNETSNESGGSGVTYIRDSVGGNHLELIGGAEVYWGNGLLKLEYPLDGAADVDKSVFLQASGGITSLGGTGVNPLHYYFQVDEVDTFDSLNLKESGWIKHYGKYKPILKPDTQYYWRVKVRDSGVTPLESSYVPTYSFTTEGSMDWYVRNGVYSGVSSAIPVPVSGTYGGENGTSYDNAWNGLREIEWGEAGVEAGDNLYVCGDHVYIDSTSDFTAYQAIEFIREFGYSEEYPVRIRMDCSGDVGTLYGANSGFSFGLGRSKYIEFYEGNFNASTVGKDRMETSDTDIPVSTHIVFDDCTFTHGVTYWLYSGQDYWTFRNSDFSYAGNGIYTLGLDNGLNDGWGASYLLIENNTFMHLGTPEFYHQDAHAVGVQGGRGHVIQGNYIEDTGSAIEFWTGSSRMENMTVRNNFIKDIEVKGITGGSGVAVSGANTDSLGKRTGFKIYNNIIMNTGIGKTEAWQGNGISTNNKDAVEIYNNIIFNPAGRGISFGVMDAAPQGVVYNNIIVNPGERYAQIIGALGDWSNFTFDHNLYYPAIDFTTDFYFSQAIDRDNYSVLGDPKFVSLDPQAAVDFMLQGDSPAIGNGVDLSAIFDYDYVWDERNGDWNIGVY